MKRINKDNPFELEGDYSNSIEEEFYYLQDKCGNFRGAFLRDKGRPYNKGRLAASGRHMKIE